MTLYEELKNAQHIYYNLLYNIKILSAIYQFNKLPGKPKFSTKASTYPNGKAKTQKAIELTTAPTF